jgi:hypothetical protein
MSEITFSASLDTSKLDAAVKQSNQTVGQWAKDVEKAGGVADAGLNKMTKSFKDAITEQKVLIKSIESDIKTLQKAYDDASSGKVKSAIGGDLGQAKRALAEEQGTLLDLQKQQVEGNKAEASSADGIIGKLKGWALGLVSVGAAMKIGQAIIASTNETQIAFEKITGAASAAVGYFFRAIASGDWTNFSQGMDRAIKGATEYVDAMANLRNEENAQKIKSSEEDIKIAELRDSTYNKDEKNRLTRYHNLLQIIELEKTKYTEEAALAKSAYDINLQKAASDSGLSTQQIANFLKEYKSLEDLIRIGKEYNEITNLTRKPGIDAGYLASLYKERDALQGNAAAAGEYVTQIGKITPEVRKQLSDAAASANEAIAAFGQKNKRDKMQAAEAWNVMWDAWMTEIDATNKVWDERNDIGKKIADQEKLLNDAVADGDTAQVTAIANRIKLLEDEQRVRENIAKAALLTAMTEGRGNLTPATISNIKVNIPFTAPSLPGLQGATTQAALAAQNAVAKQWNIDDLAYDEQKKKDLKEILRGAIEITMQLAKQVGMSDEAAQAIVMTVDALGKLSTDPIGSAIDAIQMIISMLPNEAAKFADQMEIINQAITEAQRLIDLSERSGGGDVARQNAVDLAKAKQTADEIALQAAIDKKNNKIFAFGSVYEADKKKVIELTGAVADDQAAIVAAQQALTDFITATNEINIADSIEQGFEAGKSSAADFADTFEGFMTQAINSSLEEMSKPAIAEWYAKFAEDMSSGGGLSETEKADLKAQWDVIIAEGEANRLAAYAAAGIVPTTADKVGTTGGLAGQISKNITEDTGSELAGLFRRFADDERGVRDYTKMGVDHMIGIEKNTLGTWDELIKANKSLENAVYALDKMSGITYVAKIT